MRWGEDKRGWWGGDKFLAKVTIWHRKNALRAAAIQAVHSPMRLAAASYESRRCTRRRHYDA
ncbi:hypothetical protein VF13_39430 [Nostoc linckia z16]|nr:hypothetical protein VF13_39430 [Nostoc linckia z16]